MGQEKLKIKFDARNGTTTGRNPKTPEMGTTELGIHRCLATEMRI